MDQTGEGCLFLFVEAQNQFSQTEFCIDLAQPARGALRVPRRGTRTSRVTLGHEEMISIRQMTESDDEAVCRISAACYHFAAQVHDFTEQQVDLALQEHCTRQHVSSLRTNGNALVAELDGQVVGAIITSDNIIQALFVDPAIHRKGIGRVLFQNAEESIARAGYPTLTLRTRPFAVPFYLAMGMKCDGYWHPQEGPLAGLELTVLEKNMKPQPAL